VIALVAVIVVDLLAIGANWLEIDLLSRAIDGKPVSMSELDSSDNRQAVLGLLGLAVVIAAAVFFIRWFHAAYANLRALGREDLRFGTGWAIGAWFVPFLNLWRPKQIANDIWRGSNPNVPFQPAPWKETAVPTFLELWWGAWIIADVGQIAMRVWFESETAEELRTAAYADIGFLVVDVVAAALAIVVVRQLTFRQDERVRRSALFEVSSATMRAA
jgi:hypothetical protein